jgi:hypothetical protein
MQGKPIDGRMLTPVEQRKRILITRQHTAEEDRVIDRFDPNGHG